MHHELRSGDEVVRVAHIAGDLAHLPGAPTPDWCQRAAVVLTNQAPATRAWAMVIGPGRASNERHTEAAGYAEGADLSPDQAPKPLALAMVRCVLDALENLGQPSVVSVGQLLELASHTPRGVTLLRRHQHLLIGVAEVERASDRTPYPRLLIICWDQPTHVSSAPTNLRLVLQSVLPGARDRLRQALGRDGHWLTACEQRVLDMLTEGFSVREIANALDRSPHTIADQVKQLHAKLGTNSRGTLLARVLGNHPPPDLPVRRTRTRGSTLAFRTAAYVDHRGW